VPTWLKFEWEQSAVLGLRFLEWGPTRSTSSERPLRRRPRRPPAPRPVGATGQRRRLGSSCPTLAGALRLRGPPQWPRPPLREALPVGWALLLLLVLEHLAALWAELGRSYQRRGLAAWWQLSEVAAPPLRLASLLRPPARGCCCPPPAAAAPAALAAPGAGGALGAAAPAGAAGIGYFDLRVLPVQCDLLGDRLLPFDRAVQSFREDLFADWPIKGPRSCFWVCRYIALNGGSPTGRHARWKHDAKLQSQDPLVSAHERCCRLLETMACYDQINLPNSATAENLARSLQVQEERWRERDSHQYCGAYIIRLGRACPELTERVAKELSREHALPK
ncbi:unnamed protein product, partial [Prorocentrum cordatum]